MVGAIVAGAYMSDHPYNLTRHTMHDILDDSDHGKLNRHDS